MSHNRGRQSWISRVAKVTLLALVALVAGFVTDAGATCFEKPFRPGAAPQMMFGRASAGGTSTGDDREASGSRESIVGMWSVSFFFGAGPDLFDIGFQQFHSDGTEFNLSGGLSPSLGNVCIGVWKQTGPRTIRLKHVAFNWDANGANRGTFLLIVTLRLDRDGNSLSGRYVADSFDLDGHQIPAEHVEGLVKGTRISVD